MSLSGIIIIDKPKEWTSHDVVAKLRSALRQKSDTKQKLRVGHGGTLDPMATGVLPVFTGRATRAAEFAENAEKEYIAGIRFGIVTDTQDTTGAIVNKCEARVTAGELSAVLARFSGKQKQIPPMYSAIKKDGKKLYELARRGVEVERPARDIEIFAIELTDKPPESCNDSDKAVAAVGTDAFIRVACSKGTYIRTLCHDIGTALGCGAAMSYLRRTKAGVFTIDMAHRLDEVIDAAPADLENLLLPVDSIFAQYPSVVLSSSDTQKAKNGALRRLHGSIAGKCKLYSPEGEFLLFGEVSGDRLKPIKSFFEV